MLSKDFSSADSYDAILEQLKSLIDPSFSEVANMANIASLLYWSVEGVNWVGFYIFDNERLMLGPFHGKPACVTIEIGKGVCGTSAERRETVIVPDVEDFPGHIACDDSSRSEMVIPMLRNGELLGVLDVDSPTPGRFERKERELFEAIVRLLLATHP
jgi:GAF domain-containing protein